MPSAYPQLSRRRGTIAIAIIPANIRGQGIAWDRSSPGVLYGIIRATDEETDQGVLNKVVVFKSNVSGKPKKWRRAGVVNP